MMNSVIKKILKEEEGEFDWIKEIPDFNIHNPWIIHNDMGDREGISLQSWLMNFGWGYDDANFRYDLEPDFGPYFFNIKNTKYEEKDSIPNSFDSFSELNNWLKNEISKGTPLFKWSELKKVFILGESEEDDWSWIEEIPSNLPKNEKELSFFIGWSFIWDISRKNGEWGYSGRKWIINEIKENVVYYIDNATKELSQEEITHFLKNINDGVWVLVTPEGNILDPIYNRTYNPNVNESQDDFEWARETNPKLIQKYENDTFSPEYDVILNYFNSRPILEYMGWKYSIDSHSGAVEWWKEGVEGMFYATPFWDGQDYLPIDYQGEDDYDNVAELTIPQFNYEEELIEWLDNEYPKVVLKEIMYYHGPLHESTDFFDSLKDDEEKPKIIPGGIVDTLVGNFSQDEILERLHELGYEWLLGMKIFVNGRLAFEPFRYIFIGPIGGEVAIGELKLVHDNDLKWIKDHGLLDLVYRT